MIKEGRIFFYVSPNLLLPTMFLTLVISVLLVHASVLNNTTWMGDFWQGSAAGEVVEMAGAEPAPAVVETAPTE